MNTLCRGMRVSSCCRLVRAEHTLHCSTIMQQRAKRYPIETICFIADSNFCRSYATVRTNINYSVLTVTARTCAQLTYEEMEL